MVRRNALPVIALAAAVVLGFPVMAEAAKPPSILGPGSPLGSVLGGNHAGASPPEPHSPASALIPPTPEQAEPTPIIP